MTSLRERALMAHVNKAGADAEVARKAESERKRRVRERMRNRLHGLLVRVIETTMPISDLLLVERAEDDDIDWTRATMRGVIDGYVFETTSVFDATGYEISYIEEIRLKVWIPCGTCGHETGPLDVGSLAGLGGLIALWERCETCRRAATAATDYPDLDSSCGAEDAPAHYPTVPTTATPGRMSREERRRQGGGREALA